MKIMAIADLHGSEYYGKLAYAAFEKEQPDKLITLGDMVYQGVRNPATRDYSGLGSVDVLNKMADRSIGVRGNCDADVHQEFLQYPMMSDYLLLCEGKRTIFATHGHIWSEDNLPHISKGDVLLQGHTHLTTWKCVNGIYIFNPGSLACPKQDTRRGYLIIEDGTVFTWKDVETGEEFHKEVLD